jgi:hypothetical protein
MYKSNNYIKEYLECFNIEFDETEDGIVKYPTYQLLTVNNKKYRVFDSALVTAYDLPNLDGLITFSKFHYDLMKPKIDKMIYLPIINIGSSSKKEGNFSFLSVNNYFEVYEQHKDFILQNRKYDLVIPHYFDLWKPHQYCLDRIPGQYKRYKHIKELNCQDNYYIIGHELYLDLVPIVTHFLNNPESIFYLLASYDLEKTFLLNELRMYFNVHSLENYRYILSMKSQQNSHDTIQRELEYIFN